MSTPSNGVYEVKNNPTGRRVMLFVREQIERYYAATVSAVAAVDAVDAAVGFFSAAYFNAAVTAGLPEP